MTKDEILAELPKLKIEELAEVQAKIDELTSQAWLDKDEPAEYEKAMLDAALEDHRKNPDNGIPWREALAQIREKVSAKASVSPPLSSRQFGG